MADISHFANVIGWHLDVIMRNVVKNLYKIEFLPLSVFDRI